ncbi:MAG: hypothetical protein V7K21_03070 [Nostoc sp.]
MNTHSTATTRYAIANAPGSELVGRSLSFLFAMAYPPTVGDRYSRLLE